MTFPIEEGVVEITAEIDRNSIRASAAAAGKTAGDELEKSTRDSFDKSTSSNRGAFSNILRKAVTPSAGAFAALRAPFTAALSTPIGAAVIAVAGTAALAFVGAFATALATAGLGAVFLGIGAAALLGAKKDREAAQKDLDAAEERVRKAEARAKSGTAASKRSLAEARAELAEAQKVVAQTASFQKLDMSLNKLGTTLRDVGARAARPLMVPLTKSFDFLTKTVKSLEPTLTNIFAQLAPAIPALTAGIAGFATEFLKVLTADPAALQGMRDALIAVGANLPKVGAALGELFSRLATNENNVRNIGLLFDLLVFSINSVGASLLLLSSTLDFIVAGWNKVIAVTKAVAAWFAGPFASAMVTAFNAVVGFFTSIPGWISTAFSAVGTFFSNLWTTVSTFVVNIVNSVIGFFIALPGRIMGALAALPGLLVSYFTTMLGAVAYAIGFAIGTIVGFWIALPGRILSAITALPGLIAGVFNSVRSTATSIVTGLINSVVSFFAQLPGRAYSAVVGIISRIQSVMSSARSTAISGASSLVSGLISILSQIPGKAASAVKGIGSAMAGAISSGAGAVRNAGAALLRALVGGINGLVGWAIGQAKNAIHSIVQGIKDALPGSPVKEGPLTVLNNGYAGRQIVRMITDGIDMEAAKISTGFTRSLADSLLGLGDFQAAPPTRGVSFSNPTTSGSAGNVINLGGVQVTFNGAAPENPTAYGAEVAQSIARSLSAAGLAAGR